MNLKKMIIFPAVSTFFLILAMVFGMVAASNDPIGMTTDMAIAIACLVPFCLNVIAMVGALKNSKTMVIIGTCVVLMASFIGNTAMAGSASAAYSGTGTLMTLIWAFYVMIWIVSIMLMVSGFVSNASKNKTTFMLAAGLLSAFFYIGFFIFVLCGFMIAGREPFYAIFSIFFGLSTLTIIGTTLAIAVRGIKKNDEPEEEEQPGLTHTPKSLRLAKDDPIAEIKKWKELLDCGALTQEEFDDKKAEILARKE